MPTSSAVATPADLGELTALLVAANRSRTPVTFRSGGTSLSGQGVSDGILVDVHPDPETALCDGPQSVNGKDLRDLASAVRRLVPALGRA